MDRENLYRYTLVFKVSEIDESFEEAVDNFAWATNADVKFIDDEFKVDHKISVVKVVVFYSHSISSLADCMYEFGNKFPKSKFPSIFMEKYFELDDKQEFEDID